MQCFHCGREVRETSHTPKGYRVDYYLLHTGRTERIFVKDPNDSMTPMTYLKLTEPVALASCIECYADPLIKKRLDDDFHGLKSIFDEAPPAGLDDASPFHSHG
jgi:hypothetical protein